MSTELQLCIFVVAFHAHRMCVCNFLAVYFLFLPLIHTWPYVGNWTAAGSNNLHRVLARVIGLTAFGCCSWFLRGYVLLRLSTVPVSKIRSWVWYSPPPQFSMCLEISPQPWHHSVLVQTVRERQLFYGGKGGTQRRTPASALPRGLW